MSLPQKKGLSRETTAVVEEVPWALPCRWQRDSGGCVFRLLPSLRAWEGDRSLSLAEVGGAIIGSTVNLSLIRRHAKLKGPGVISQMSAY